MKLKSLNIELQWYGEFTGQYVGKVQFEDNSGSVAMTLPPSVSNVVLAAIGDNLAAITKKTADELAENIRRSVEVVKTPAIELGASSPSTS